MDINVLKTFIAVSEYGGFSNAAEKLGYTQSTVSFQIKQLEKELGTTLFERYYHRTALTSDGEKVLKHARDILKSHEQIIESLTEPEHIKGEIRIAVSSSICNMYFNEDYVSFRDRYPDIRLVITETTTENMFDMLRKNEADAVFTLDNHIYDSEFMILAEREEKVSFVTAASNPVTKKGEIGLEELCSESFVLTEKNMSYRKTLDSELALRSLEIQPVLEVGSPRQICSIVRKSNLFSFLPAFVIDKYIESEELEILKVKDMSVSVWIQLMIHRNKWVSPALRAFLDYYSRKITENT